MAYMPTWERLSDAQMRVMETNTLTQEQAQSDICQAITDGEVRIRAKLGTRIPGGTKSRDTVLEGKELRIPTNLKPEELNWQESRPIKPWLVPREAFRANGYWTLEWVELYRADVINALCAPSKGHKPAQPVLTGISAKKRSRPALDRARRAIREIYPDGPPEQSVEPNQIFCGRVGKWLKDHGLSNVSNDTILRAGRRRN